MAIFQGDVEYLRSIREVSNYVALTRIKGLPLEGMTVTLGAAVGSIIGVTRDLAGHAVRTHDCDTGKISPPFAAVVMEWTTRAKIDENLIGTLTHRQIE